MCRLNPAADHLAFLRRIVDEQAEDEGLWFIAQTAPEAYLQQELRRLHTYIECATGKVGGADLYGPMHSAFAPDDPVDVESAPPLLIVDEDGNEVSQAAAHLRLIARDLRGQGADVRIVRFSEDGVTDEQYTLADELEVIAFNLVGSDHSDGEVTP